MGLLSSRTSVTCYQVEGTLPKPIVDSIEKGLANNAISNIDNKPVEKATGWTSFETPYVPNFSDSSFLWGTDLIFSLRLDKKTVSTRVVRKQCEEKAQKYMEKTGQKILAKNERKTIKEKVLNDLILRIPATPQVYDLVWKYEESRLWFFSNLKGANEELENIFFKSFSLRLLRLFPYTIADLTADFSDKQKDDLFKTSPTNFME